MGREQPFLYMQAAKMSQRTELQHSNAMVSGIRIDEQKEKNSGCDQV